MGVLSRPRPEPGSPLSPTGFASIPARQHKPDRLPRPHTLRRTEPADIEARRPHGLSLRLVARSRWAHDPDGSVLSAPPGQAQRRPVNTPGSQPISRSSACPSCISQDAPVPVSPSRPDLHERPELRPDGCRSYACRSYVNGLSLFAGIGMRVWLSGAGHEVGGVADDRRWGGVDGGVVVRARVLT